MSFEKRLDLQNTSKNVSLGSASTVNLTTSNNSSTNGYSKNQNAPNSRASFQNNGGRGNSRGRGRGRWNGGNNRPTCQICFKQGHTALNCYKLLNKGFSRNQNGAQTNLTQNSNSNGQNQQFNQAFMATQTNNPFVAIPESVVDPGWYVDSGASNHVTGDPNNMTYSSKYGGNSYGSSGAEGGTQ